jgi:sulfane dehydrogenase subunit SoxC
MSGETQASDGADRSTSDDASESVVSRRALLVGALGTATAALVRALPGQQATSSGPAVAASVQSADPTHVAGHGTTAVGTRAPSVQLARAPAGLVSGEDFTPIQDLQGIITPSDLHFERHHAGVPNIDPEAYRLLIHGLVDRPLVLTLADLRRFPARSRICFVECSGNGRKGYRAMSPQTTPQQIDGLTSTSEWTGTMLSTLLEEVGVQSGAKWLLAEGGDAAVMTRSIPIEKALDDAMVVYAQNGEPLRPEQGFPVRLLLPGWEGNSNVKWLRRIKLGDQPFMTREETSKYTDALRGEKARQFSFVMDAKSIITYPAYPTVLGDHGWWEIRGIAWSGRGRIAMVEVSTDGGTTWSKAELEDPILAKAHTRFRSLWNWNGVRATLMSRATDETGYVQPTLAMLRGVRGPGTNYHINNIRAWDVDESGHVTFAARL